MRKLQLFNTVHGGDGDGGKKRNVGDGDEEQKGGDKSIFYKIYEFLRRFRDWLNSSVGEPILAAFILFVFIFTALPLLKKMFDAYKYAFTFKR